MLLRPLCALLFASWQLGCTFYTACPNGTNPANSGNGASGGGGDNNGAGGSSGGSGSGVVGPVPTGTWQNVTSNLADQPTQCGNVGYLASKPNEDLLIVGVALVPGGAAGDSNVPLWWGSADGGGSWQPLGQGAGSAVIQDRPTSLLFDPGNPDVFWVVGTYGELSLHRTEDGGKTFKTLGTVKHNDFVSVDFTDPARQTALLSAHEQGHVLMRSTNGGADWSDIGGNMPDGVNACDFPWVVDSQNFLFGCSQYGGGTGGIFRSADAGGSWQSVGSIAGVFGEPMQASDGALYWMTTNGLARSDTQGSDWQSVSYGLTGTTVIELPDKRLATLADYVVVSADRGQTWTPVTSQPPFKANGLAYSAFQKAFFVWQSNCDTKVPSNAIMRYDFDYQATP